MMKTGVIFARVSSSGNLEARQNCERQVADLMSYAEYTGIEVVHVYQEHISGAKKNEERSVLTECIEFCALNSVDIVLTSELSRLGRDVFELQGTINSLIRHGIDLFCQKEQFRLLGEDGKPSMIAPIMIAVLGTCAQLERENIQYRLNSGRAQYIAKGGRLGRKVGYRKPVETKEKEYAEAIRLIRRGRNTIKEIAKLSDTSISTVQRLKKEFLADCGA